MLALKAKFSGQATITGTGVSTTATLPRPVNLSKSISYFTFSTTTSTQPKYFLIVGGLTDASTFTFERFAGVSGQTVTIEWQVLEFVGDINVQRGRESLTQLLTTNDITIKRVDMNHSFPMGNATHNSSAYGNNDDELMFLENPTTLRVTVASAITLSSLVYWQVVSSRCINVQRLTFTSTSTSGSNALSKKVNPKKSIVFGHYYTTGDADTATHNIYSINSTGTAIDWELTRALGTHTFYYHIIEFNDGINCGVVHGTLSGASGTAVTQAITKANPSRSMVMIGGWNYTGGEQPAHGDDMGYAAWRVIFNSGSELAFTRGISTSYKIYYSIISFGPRIRCEVMPVAGVTGGVSQYFKELTSSSSIVESLSLVSSFLKAFSKAVACVPVLNKLGNYARSISASTTLAISSFLRGISKSVSAQVVGGAALSASKAFFSNLASSMALVVTLAKLLVGGKVLAVTASCSASFVRLLSKSLTKAVSVSGTVLAGLFLYLELVAQQALSGSLDLLKVKSKDLVTSLTGVPSFSKLVTLLRGLTASVNVNSLLAILITLAKTLAASAVGSVALLRAISKAIAAQIASGGALVGLKVRSALLDASSAFSGALSYAPSLARALGAFIQLTPSFKRLIAMALGVTKRVLVSLYARNLTPGVRVLRWVRRAFGSHF